MSATATENSVDFPVPSEKTYFEPIEVTSTIKLKNPLNKSDLGRYEGPTEGFDFQQQTANYEALQQSLVPFATKLTYLWYGYFTRQPTSWVYRPQQVSHFVVRDETGDFFWQKYEANSHGSGQNRLYVRGKKIKTTDWLKMSETERKDIFLSSLE